MSALDETGRKAQVDWGQANDLSASFPIPIIKGCKAPPFHGVCFVSVALSLADKAADGGGVCFNFGAENQFTMFFTKQLGGDALESLDDLRCRA